MAKDPAFLFYPGDFSTGTQFLTDEQVGKYVRLLMAQHQTGHLHEKHMIQICKTHDKDIFDKFVKDENGLYYNERLEKEIVKRKKYSAGRADNRRRKEEKSVTYVEHMENRNKNIVIPIKNSKVFNTMPVSENFNGLPNQNVQAVIELFKISKYKKIDKEQVNAYWNYFKIQNLTGLKYYQDEDSVYSHFMNWVKMQDIKDKPPDEMKKKSFKEKTQEEIDKEAQDWLNQE